jgi:hypothetical protein
MELGADADTVAREQIRYRASGAALEHSLGSGIRGYPYSTFVRRGDSHWKNHEAQTVQLQPLEQLECSMVVQKAAEKAVELFVEDELSGEENSVRELAGDFQAKMM